MGELGPVLIVVLWILVALISGSLATEKGRSGLGWFAITMVCPLALLFCLIASDVSLEKKMHKYYDSKNS